MHRVDQSIRQVKDRAEKFLFKEMTRISKGIRNKDNSVLCPPESSNLPLVFEAHAYLCHKKENLKPRYAKELRDLWIHWKNFRETLKPKALDIFYPAWEYYYPEGDESPIWQGFSHEVHIPMLRAKEILGIPGFQNDFDKVLKIIKNLLINGGNYRDFWIVFRSRSVQEALEKYIQKYANSVMNKLELESDYLTKYFQNKLEVDFYDRFVYYITYLCMSKLEGDYIKIAKSATDTIIQHLEKNGSFKDDIIATCHFTIPVLLTGSDPARIILNDALNWLLSKQNSDGSWNHWGEAFRGEVTSNRVLSTVIVLETIDLITNNKRVCQIFCVNPIFASKHFFPYDLQKRSSIVSIS